MKHAIKAAALGAAPVVGPAMAQDGSPFDWRRVFVQEEIVDQVIDGLAARVRDMPTGGGAAEGAQG